MGRSGTDQQSRRVPMTRGLGLRFALLTGMAIGLVALSALIQELQAASTAWIAGQGYWSRGQQDATAALSRYLARGNVQDLDDARQALQVPLGDLQARLALAGRQARLMAFFQMQQLRVAQQTAARAAAR